MISSAAISARLTKSPAPFIETCRFSTSRKSLTRLRPALRAALIIRFRLALPCMGPPWDLRAGYTRGAAGRKGATQVREPRRLMPAGVALLSCGIGPAQGRGEVRRMRLRNDYFPHEGAGGVARAAAGFVLALALVHPAEASEHALTRYGPFHFHHGAPQVIHLDGLLTPGAERAFQRLLAASGAAATMVLRSEGGNVRAALRIAQEIDRRGLDTIVPPGAGCYSACAFLFLAGRNREALGELGVHQIASASENFESGQIAIAEVLEALLGFDTPGEVLVAMLRTPHSAIHVFDREELERLGLHRKPPPQASGRMQVAAAPPKSEREAEASGFVARLQRLWSRETGQALEDLRSHYALVVHYNGTVQSRD